MRIETFLKQSPMFCIALTARRFDALTTHLLQADDLNFLEALILSTLFFESPTAVKPSQLAETFGATRSNVSHCIASLEGKGLLQRKIDPADARAYQLYLKPQGKKCALRVVSAFEKLQRGFEREVGKTQMISMLETISRLESIFPAKV